MVEIIEIDKWKRRDSFRMFVRQGSDEHYATVLQGCTNLYEISKREQIPIVVVVYHAIISAVNHFEQFRVRVLSSEYIAMYRQIDLITAELTKEKQLTSIKTLFNPSLREFYQTYKENRKKIKLGIVNYSDISSINVVSCSALTSLRLTHISSRSPHCRCERGVLRFTFGKVDVKDGVASVHVSVNFSHSLLGGYDWHLFAKYFSNEYGQEDKI
ncbi:MAG: CatA-like O-acetyltransferase [Rikenellaceae bacterium]